MRRIAIALTPLVIVGLGVEIVGGPADVGSYERFLPSILLPAADPVFGPGEHEYAITYGLVLSAAGAAGDSATREQARSWLEDDLLPGGWGMAWTWDPFHDGSPTPAGTPFGITTAIAIDGLLDVGMDAAMADRIGRVLVHWAEEAWSDGFFWYSLAPQDAVDTPHVSAMLAGVAARFLATHHATALSAPDAALLRARITATFEHLAAKRLPGLRWSYSERQPVVNDTGIHVYILWGGERARDAGIPVAWTRDEAIASLEAYGPVYPRGIVLTPSMAARRASPWQTHGTGAGLSFAAIWGGNPLRWSAALCETLAVTTRIPRFDAHALRGMAIVGKCICPGRRDKRIGGVGRSC